jgi:6-phosphogluconolactonase/glucosamine-6-phosphate isomerase/deaminase
MTVPELLSAGRTVVLVTGAEKAEAVAMAFRADITQDVPASLLREGRGPLDVFLDPAAAGRTGL